MSHRARKRFSQNFLQDDSIINAIIQAIHLDKKDNVVEIGPGLGALTKPLLEELDSLTAIEIDTDLQQLLLERAEFKNKLKLICGDALKVDFSSLGKNLRLIGNLPYNISTPLLIKLLHFTPYILDMHFMLQKEVADRIVAGPGSKTYGRLSVMIQCYYEVSHVLDVDRHAFHPVPKVESSIIRLSPIINRKLDAANHESLERLVAKAFSMRRKTLANNLKPLITAEELLSIGVNPTLRPEQISITEYIQIEKFISR
ncbi:MAG: 16S rRNA (adenine(1518)-N(6)/adenine(1519)-N(6))-dimethyltransferase RsmA [Legionellaceae bacterium]|nr:16S rRNA (adenine(1518)-N(6)/adenine(1519)-N(6))-dimethyltransferase RsmA [Legionellaceae bacterium]